MDYSNLIPQYDGKESMTKYLQKIELFTLKLNEEKYKLLLEFLNEWLQLTNKMKSLSEFKNISEDVLLKNKKRNRNLLRKYSSIIIDKLNVKFDINEDTDSDDIKDKYIIYFLSKSLESINYYLTSWQKNNVVFYTIKSK
jgi:hypothetical protein